MLGAKTFGLSLKHLIPICGGSPEAVAGTDCLHQRESKRFDASNSLILTTCMHAKHKSNS